MTDQLPATVVATLERTSDPERAATELLDALQSRFGWTGVVLTRRDVDQHLERPVTDAEWARLTVTGAWRAIPPIFREGACDYLEQALAEAGVA